MSEASSLYDPGILSDEALWLWTAFRTAWFMVPCVSFCHVCPLFEMWSKIHVWTWATIRFSANDCNRWSLKADFGLKFFSLQTKRANCLLLIRCCKFAPTPSVGFWTMMYLQWCTFNLNLWSPQFAVLLICRRCPQKPPVSRHLEACPGFSCLSLFSLLSRDLS